MAPNAKHIRTDTFTTAMTNLTLSPSSSIPFPPAPTDCMPPEHSRRTIVLCFDGTGNEFDADNSNVVEFFSMLKKNDRTQQVVYYQPGIGTYISRHSSRSKFRNKVREVWDQAVASDVAEHVIEGYNFLMQNFVNGDKISLFGFSRGAYTARALAGMLHKVGLLPPGNEEQVRFAYKMFERTSSHSWTLANQFKDAFAIDVKVDFLGVWDTVSSVGLLDVTLPFSASNASIRVFRHAMALDERRTKFQANHWNPPSEEQARLGTQYTEEEETDVKEVWFSGTHGDVGGGCVPNGTKHSLAKIPLRWMLKECFRSDSGIMFDVGKVHKLTGLTPEELKGPRLLPVIGYDPETVVGHSRVSTSTNAEDKRTKTHRPSTSIDKHPYADDDLEEIEEEFKVAEAEADRRELEDLTQRAHDQLSSSSLKALWWALEYMPLRRMLVSMFDGDKPITGLRKFILEHPINRGRGRKIPKYDSDGNKVPIYVHRSVWERIREREYTPAVMNWAEVVGKKENIIWTD